jgi:hypothetical protein
MTNNSNIKISKQKVTATSRKLSDHWKFEVSQPVVEMKIEDILIDEIRKEIDSDIIEKVCLGNGWYKVSHGDQEWPEPQLTAWMTTHCQARFHIFYGRCLFQSQEDAALFQLTWA